METEISNRSKMDVNVQLDATASDAIESEVDSTQNVENCNTVTEAVFASEKEAVTIDTSQCAACDDPVATIADSDAAIDSNAVTNSDATTDSGVIADNSSITDNSGATGDSIVDEAVATNTMERLIVNDQVYQVEVVENTQDIHPFVTTECTTDGIVTYVTIAPSLHPDTISTGVVEHVTCEKPESQGLQESYENVRQDNMVTEEENYQLPKQSYEKFVQDAIEGEMEEPVMETVEMREGRTDIVEGEKVVEASEKVEQGMHDPTHLIEAKLQELTEGPIEQQNVDSTDGNYKENISMEFDNAIVTEVDNDVPVDEQLITDDHSSISETEEHITGDYIGGRGHSEQNIIGETEILESETMVITTSLPTQDNIEKQLSKIVHDEEPHQLSIAEEISRDFDDSDSEELTVSQQEPDDNVIEEVVNIAKQLGHGTVTVTDTSGQVYYVESVEEVIVVEDDMKMDESKICKTELIKDDRPAPPPIPSHLLGRNIENPVEDTFRNGKTPPKPRLGVKIPYKNLTSQIVSKEDITKEVLERSKSKMMQNRASREAYFAKQLTRRLAKKIAPNRAPEVKTNEKELNNSDLIAILEGKDEEKHAQDNSETEEKVGQMDKQLERELALKQLSELPKRGRRRIHSGYDIIENVNIPPRVRRSDLRSEREEIKIEKIENTKVIAEEMNKNVEVKAAVEAEKHRMTNKSNMETKETHKDANKVNIDKSNFETNKPKVIVEKSNVDSKKVDIKNPIIDKQKIKIIDAVKSKGTESKTVLEAPRQTVQKNEFPERDPLGNSGILSKVTDDGEKKIINPPIKTYERKRKSTDENITPIPEKKLVIKNVPADAYITKSSRIIKKKIIWDPDDPTTAKFAAEKISPQKVIKGGTAVRVIVKETRKVESPSTETRPTVKQEKDIPRPEKIIAKLEKTLSKPVQKETKTKSPEVTNKCKKRLTEVDKLLMDEGAVNLLYSVKNDDIKKLAGTTISLDKIQRELMNEIKKELTNSTDRISPKSLRKKDSPAATPTKKQYPASVSRKKSKDSNRSSIHSPPASPSPMIFVNHADASRIIRRHSSSSYSSTEGDEERKDDKKPAKKKLKKENERAKVNKQKLNDENFSKLDEENKSNDYDFDYSKYEHYKAIRVGQLDNLVQVSLLCDESEKTYLSYDVLLELSDLLKELQTDDSCKVVVLSSTTPSFCHGINYRSLHIEDEHIRKEIAQKLAKAVTQYLKMLASFPKIIIAGVQGECIGLAVTMLPLFDMVLASDTASFSIPNAKLGCAAEGGSLLSLPHLMHNALVSEMLYAARKFVAAEVLRFGMVTRVIWPDKFQSELIAAVKEISTHSLQFKQITKRQLRNRMKDQIEESLTGEEEVLLETWISAECQRNFETYDQNN